jgi:hypothetical protein
MKAQRRLVTGLFVSLIFLTLVTGRTQPTVAQFQPDFPTVLPHVPDETTVIQPDVPLMSSENASPINASNDTYAFAEVLIVDDGCDGNCGGDPTPPGLIRECPWEQDPWICISCQRPVYCAQYGGAMYANTLSSPQCWVGWQPTIASRGCYKIEVHIPSYLQGYSKTSQAQYIIHHAGGTTTKTINQSAYACAWVSLGTYRCNAGTGCYVTLENYTGESERVIDADAARFTLQVPDEPTLQDISNPEEDGDYTVEWSSGFCWGTRYELQERLNGGSWGEIYDGSGTQRSLSNKGTGRWCYRVRACNSSGCSGWSSTKCTNVRPDKPDLFDIM